MTVRSQTASHPNTLRRSGQGFLQGALILSAGVMIVKLLGAIYKIPLTNMIGEIGMGYFNTAYQLYLPIYTLSTAGFPVTVSRMVSAYGAQKNMAGARSVFHKARLFFLCSGLLGMAGMALGAVPYAVGVGSAGAVWSIWALAPTILLCCLASAYRGYYSGMRNMTPTAVSQVLEALGRLVCGLGIAYAVLIAARQSYAHTGEVFGQPMPDEAAALSTSLSYAAAGATLGVTLGAVFSLVYLMAFDRVHMPPSTGKKTGVSVRVRDIAVVALPICAGALVVNLGAMLDAVMMQKRLCALSEDIVRDLLGTAAETMEQGAWIPFLYGSFTMAQNLSMLVPSLAQAIGTSALPNVTASAARGAWEQVRDNVEDVLFWSGALAFPAGLGLSVLAEPILELLYHARPVGAALAVRPLQLLGIASIGMTISVPVNSMLQALGKEKTPMGLLVLGVAVKAAANYQLIADPQWNLSGGAMGTLVCYGLAAVLGLWCLRRSCPIKPRLFRCFWAPALGAVLCAAGAGWIWRQIHTTVPIAVGVGASLLGAVVIYAAVLLLCCGKKIRQRVAKRSKIR